MTAFYVGILVVVLFLVGGVAMSYVPYFKIDRRRNDAKDGEPIAKH